jgi:hypothetical protein
MKPGSCIINTASINSDAPTAGLRNDKGCFTAGLAQLLAENVSAPMLWRLDRFGRR